MKMRASLLLPVFFAVATAAFGNELTTRFGTLRGQLEYEIALDEERPVLPSLKDLQELDAVIEEFVGAQDLMQFGMQLQHLNVIFIGYATHLARYPAEFSYISTRLITFTGIALQRMLREDAEGSIFDPAAFVAGYGQMLQGLTMVFLADGEIEERYRIEIAEVTIGEMDRNWKHLPVTARVQILASMEAGMQRETSSSIGRLVGDFLSTRNIESEMMQ